jgi:hypothetical protein
VVGGILGLLITSVIKEKAMAQALSLRSRRQPRVHVARTRRGQYAGVPELGVR